MSPAEKYDEFFDDSDFKQEAQRFLKLNSKYSILAITNVESMSFFVYQLQSSNWRVTKKSISIVAITFSIGFHAVLRNRINPAPIFIDLYYFSKH